MSDYLLRATAEDAQVRAFAVTSRDLTEAARQAHQTSPVVTAALGRLLSAGVMMGSMLKSEQDLLTILIRGDGPAKGLTVTADAKGHVKGYANEPWAMLPANAKGKLDVGGILGRGYLKVIKDMGLKEPYVGQVELQTGEVAEDLTYYFAASEQIPSSVGLGVLMNRDNTVACAGGFIVQLMPHVSEEVTDRLEQNLARVTSVTDLLAGGCGPEGLLRILLDGLNMEILSSMPVSFACDCSRERVERALISLGRRELEDMIGEGKTIQVGCQFCGKSYDFTVSDLKELLERA